MAPRIGFGLDFKQLDQISNWLFFGRESVYPSVNGDSGDYERHAFLPTNGSQIYANLHI